MVPVDCGRSRLHCHIVDAHLLSSWLLITAAATTAADEDQDDQQQHHAYKDEENRKRGNVPVRLKHVLRL